MDFWLTLKARIKEHYRTTRERRLAELRSRGEAYVEQALAQGVPAQQLRNEADNPFDANAFDEGMNNALRRHGP